MPDNDQQPTDPESRASTGFTSPRSTPPPLVQLGGGDALAAYESVFRQLYLAKPIFDPQGRVIIFNEKSCRHVCIHRDRHDIRPARIEGRDIERGEWDQERAEHISWILPALTDPTYIVLNNQVRGNYAYLLGYPEGDFVRPGKRYYVAVKPLGRSGMRCEFRTAYPIDQRQWDDAVRAPKGRRQDAPHVLYRGRRPRW